MAVREVAFELECFEWADERLEVAGRWKGLAGRRLNRPVLTVETEGGRRKHLVALPGGHFGAAEESWRAAFAWPGDPAEITGAELEVGGNVVVDLPLPDRRRRRRKRQAVDAGDELLRAEIVALRGQVERLRAEMAGRERENMQLRSRLDEDDEPLAVAGAGEATVEIDRLAGERDELSAELERLAEERDRTRAELSAEVDRLHAERDRMQVEMERLRDEHEHARADIDDLREAFSDAAAEAEDTRDRHRAEVAALQDELRAERATVARLTAALAAGPELPPPATPSARRGSARRGGDEPSERTVDDSSAGRDASGSTSSSESAERAADDSSAGRDASGSAERAADSSAASGSERSSGSAERAAEDSPAGAEDASESARRAAAAAPPTAPLPVARPADDPEESLPAFVDAASVPGVLDPPGPLRAGARPADPSGAGEAARSSRIPAWLRTGGGGAEEPGQRTAGPTFQALKSRLESLFASNGHAAAEEEEPAATFDAVPGPRRSASAARARAGATVAARRSAAEVWAVRVLAAVLVAVLLIAFLLILTSVA
jgi:predicted  nucleic acid-binding Zn-ribbon protein